MSDDECIWENPGELAFYYGLGKHVVTQDRIITCEEDRIALMVYDDLDEDSRYNLGDDYIEKKCDCMDCKRLVPQCTEVCVGKEIKGTKKIVSRIKEVKGNNLSKFHLLDEETI